LIKDLYERKDGARVSKFVIKFDNSNKNISSFAQRISYRYCRQKQQPCDLIAEYLRISAKAIEARIGLKKRVAYLHSAGKGPAEIAKMLGMERRYVKGLLYESERYAKTKRAKTFVKFDEWLKEGVSNQLIKEKITEKEDVSLVDVRDFTTVEESHTFIANGFVTHNCPNETPEGPSCSLVKNLAVMAEVSIGVEEEEIERILKAYDVKE
jgi:intein/homing endonuclease